MTQPILLITQYYWPELVGSGPFCTDLAEWLAGSGNKVNVFTSRPHYPTNVVSRSYRDGQRDHEYCNGVTIKRVKPWTPQRRGAAMRIAADALFMARGITALVIGRIKRTPIVISLCPSILSVLLGALAVRNGGRHVALIHDIQSGLASGLGMVAGKAMVWAMRKLERIVLNRVDHIVVLSEIMRRQLLDQGVTSPIEVLPIWVDTRKIYPVRKIRGQRPMTVLYSGNFGRKQALGQIIEMAARLKENGIAAKVVLRGAGGEAETLKRQVSRRGLKNIEFTSLVPMKRLNEGLADGDIHLVPQDDRAADFAVPSKVYTIMAAARPFIATARPGSLLWRLQERSDAFLCVPAGDVTALIDAVERLTSDPELRRTLGDNGRSYVMKHHDRSVLLERFFTLLRINPVKENDYAMRSITPADL